MENFIKKLQEQLDNMTEEAKDQWILTQARLLPEHKQEDFYQSIFKFCLFFEDHTNTSYTNIFSRHAFLIFLSFSSLR